MNAVATTPLDAAVSVLVKLKSLDGQTSHKKWYGLYEEPNDTNVSAGLLCTNEACGAGKRKWTVGSEPNECGWSTDGGYSGYGICEHDARFIALMRNSNTALVEIAARAIDLIRVREGTCGNALASCELALKLAVEKLGRVTE